MAKPAQPGLLTIAIVQDDGERCITKPYAVKAGETLPNDLYTFSSEWLRHQAETLTLHCFAGKRCVHGPDRRLGTKYHVAKIEAEPRPGVRMVFLLPACGDEACLGLASEYTRTRIFDVMIKAGLAHCLTCGKPATKRCDKCQAAPYCSVECQRVDWKKQHRDQCERPLTVDAIFIPWTGIRASEGALLSQQVKVVCYPQSLEEWLRRPDVIDFVAPPFADAISQNDQLRSVLLKELWACEICQKRASDDRPLKPRFRILRRGADRLTLLITLDCKECAAAPQAAGAGDNLTTDAFRLCRRCTRAYRGTPPKCQICKQGLEAIL